MDMLMMNLLEGWSTASAITCKTYAYDALRMKRLIREKYTGLILSQVIVFHSNLKQDGQALPGTQ
jgi:hypothetical protein